MKFVFMIDMGHGIKTPGKRANGLLEWEFNRSVGHKLYNLLSPYGIVHFTMSGVLQPFTEMTSEGRRANLEYRCQNANEIEMYYKSLYGDIQAIFVSNHANAADNENASGYSIHIFNKSDKRYEIAKSVYKAAEEVLGVGFTIKSRGIKESPFYVNKYTNMSSILIEYEFFTNPEAVKKLKDDSFRQKCADSSAKGLLNYCGIQIEEPCNKNKSIIKILEFLISRLKNWKVSR